MSLARRRFPPVSQMTGVALLVLAFLPGAILAQEPIFNQIRDSGRRDNRLNLVIFSEGYTSAELTSKFPADAEAAISEFLGTQPYQNYAPYFNVFTIAVASAESGSDHPSLNQYRNTYFNSSYETFSVDRLLTIPPNDLDPNYEDGLGKVDELLSQFVPDYDLVLMVVNDPVYGGSGGPIAIVSVNEAAAEVAVHETGHTLAYLADEYDSPVPVEAMEAPNATQETNRNLIRWHDWILQSTPIPTPENPSTYGAVIGLFEGAEYNPTGWYRPKFQCIMNTLGYPFCEVCSEALVISLYQRISLIDTSLPEPALPIPITTSETRSFSVTTPQPASATITAQWFLDDVAVPGATGKALTFHGAALEPGPHTLRVDIKDGTLLVRSDSAGELTTSVPWGLDVTAGTTLPPQLANISTRMQVLTNDNVLIGGFIVTGTVPKKVLLRAIGPSLASAGITGALTDPVLEFHEADGSVTTNDNWKDSQEAEIQATAIPPGDDRESAIVATLDPGAYTAIVRGANNTTGVGLIEVYDISESAGSVLQNISTRGFVSQGDNVMIGGLILNGVNSNVIIRALGPSLPLAGVLIDPDLELHDGNGDLLASNDNWRSDQEAEISNTGLAPSDDAESAILLRLTPGSYTAIVRGVNSSVGVALVEAYQLDD